MSTNQKLWPSETMRPQKPKTSIAARAYRILIALLVLSMAVIVAGLYFLVQGDPLSQLQTLTDVLQPMQQTSAVGR